MRKQRPISYNPSTKHNHAGVYIAWLKNEPLYVGYGSNLVRRSKKRDGGHKARYKALAECDRIELYHCDSIAQAQQLEVELISIYTPAYNHRGHYSASYTPELLKIQHAKLFGGAA